MVIEAFVYLSEKLKAVDPRTPPLCTTPVPLQNRKRPLPDELDEKSAQPPQRLHIAAPIASDIPSVPPACYSLTADATDIFTETEHSTKNGQEEGAVAFYVDEQSPSEATEQPEGKLATDFK